MKLSQFKFTFPKTMIAKSPKTPRDMCKLMVIDKETREIKSQKFKNVIDYMNEGDVLVLNDSKVFPARLYGNKEKTKAKIEVFLLRQLSESENIWDVVVDPARKVRIGNRIFLNKNVFCEVIDNTTSRGRIVRFNVKEDFRKVIDKLGKTPLPYYIKREPTEKDRELYQTVYAKNVGSVAAPAAGLHFTKELLKKIEKKGVAGEQIANAAKVNTRNIQYRSMADKAASVSTKDVKQDTNKKYFGSKNRCLRF